MSADDPLLHLSRAAGLAAYLVLWLNMSLGLGLTAMLKVPLLQRWRMRDLHEFTTLLGLGLVATHIGVLVALQQQPFAVADLLIPMSRQLNPLAPFLGISALYVLILVAGVSRLRRYIGLRLWRAFHLLSFAGFALALGHAVAAGPDASLTWLRMLYATTMLIVALLTLIRLLNRRRPAKSGRCWRMPWASWYRSS